MAGFGERPEIGQDMGQRPVQRFNAGGAGVRPGLGYGRAGGALPPGQMRQAGSPRIAPLSLPGGPPDPRAAFRGVDPATAGPGMVPPVQPGVGYGRPGGALPPGQVQPPIPAAPPAGGAPGAVDTGLGGQQMVAPPVVVNPATGNVPPVNPAAPAVAQRQMPPRPGMMGQPINYAAGLGGFQR